MFDLILSFVAAAGRTLTLFDFIRFFIAALLLILTLGFAYWKGRWPERAMATATLIQWVLEPIVQIKKLYVPGDYGLMAIQIVMLSFLIFLGVRTNRWWPWAAAGFQAGAVSVHVAMIFRPTTVQGVYGTVAVMFGYFVLLAFQIGLFENEWRKRRERLAAQGPF